MRRNGYGFALHGPQKRVRICVVVAHAVLWRCTYPFLRSHAQKWVRQSLRTPRGIWFSQKRVRFMEDSGSLRRRRGESCPVGAHVMRFGHHAHPARWPGPYGRRVLHHPIRMNSIWTAPPRGAGILLRVASPHGGRALGEPRAGQRRPTMTLHNKRRQPE